MEQDERLTMDTFLFTRVDLALRRVDSSREYTELRKREKESGEAADEVLDRLEKHERRAVRRYMEDTTARTCVELEEAYKQGLRDSFKLLVFLEAFGDGGQPW